MQAHSPVEQILPGCAQAWLSPLSLHGACGPQPRAAALLGTSALCPSGSGSQPPLFCPWTLPLHSCQWFSLWTSSRSSAWDFCISFLFVYHFGFVAFRGRPFLMLGGFQSSVTHLHLRNSRDAESSDKRVFNAFLLCTFLSGLEFWIYTFHWMFLFLIYFILWEF